MSAEFSLNNFFLDFYRDSELLSVFASGEFESNTSASGTSDTPTKKISPQGQALQIKPKGSLRAILKEGTEETQSQPQLLLSLTLFHSLIVELTASQKNLLTPHLVYFVMIVRN